MENDLTEFHEVNASQAAFALDFSMRQSPKLTIQFSEEIAARWARYWSKNAKYLPQISSTQREFDQQALDAVDHWLEKNVHAPMRAIAAAEAERKKAADYVAEQEEVKSKQDEVQKLASAWGVDKKVHRNQRIDPRKVKTLDEAIRKGTERSIPAKLRTDVWKLVYDKEVVNGEEVERNRKVITATTGKQDDAVQDAWLHLLEEGLWEDKDMGRAANLAGRSAGRDNGRTDEHYLVNSQEDLPDTDPDDCWTPAEERDVILPEDNVAAARRISDGSCSTDREVLKKSVAEAQDQHRRQILRQFQDERPDDFAFIREYVARLGGEVRFRKGAIVPISQRPKGYTPFTPAERKRAFGIISRLRRLEALEKYS